MIIAVLHRFPFVAVSIALMVNKKVRQLISEIVEPFISYLTVLTSVLTNIL